MSIRPKVNFGIVSQALSVLSAKSRVKLYLVGIAQSLVSFLDLAGVGIIGLLGALTVTGVQSRQPGNRVAAILELFGIDDWDLTGQAAILGLASITLFVSRTLITVLVSKRTLFFLSIQGAKLSTGLLAKTLSKKLLFQQSRSTQEFLFIITQGANSLTIGVLGTFINLIADISLLIVMSAGLFFINPAIAIETMLVFGLVAILVYGMLNKKAAKLSKIQYEYSVRGNEKILESLSAFREIFVRNRMSYYVKENEKYRNKLAHVYAETTFMPNISKYAIETTVVLGAFAIAVLQFATQDAPHAIATLAIFLAAGTRIAPAVLRVQQGAMLIKSSIGFAEPVISLIKETQDASPLRPHSENSDFGHLGFTPSIKIDSVSLKYPGSTTFALSEINLSIASGSVIALVGPSGAGKTSLADVILGVIDPSIGMIEISNHPPELAIEKWPGSIAYVPQDVTLYQGTFLENIALGFNREEVSAEQIWEALKVSQLEEFVRSLPDGFETQIGERGAKISGGQRQRLGIARALFTKPKLLVLDEATSALDGETEANIADSILGLKGEMTIVMIAHRLSTVRDADQVIYMDSGRIAAQGTFDEVRATVPDFDRQAQLMGL